MTQRSLANRTTFSSPTQESARDYASRRVQLSVRGKQVLDRLLLLLSPHLESPLSTPQVPLFSSTFLFSICGALQVDTSALPLVLDRLRDWRLLVPNSRYSSEGIHKLALDLAGIAEDACASTSCDARGTSHGRLRMKWLGLDPLCESLGGEPSQSTQTSLSSSPAVLDPVQKCTHGPEDHDRRRSDRAHESCQASRLGTPDSEDSSAILSRRGHAVSGFRSGCSACRHPRVSGASTPPSPQMTPPVGRRTPFGDVNKLDMHVGTSLTHPNVTGRRVATKKPKKEIDTSLQSTSRDTQVDENDPPVIKLARVQGDLGMGIRFPRQHPHPSRISNASSRGSYLPVTCVQRRAEPVRLPNRTREGDKRTSSHRGTSASVDLVLPIARHAYSPSASPIDLHSQPNRAQSLSCMSVASHAVGSVSRIPKLPSKAQGRSDKLLPFWNQSYRRGPATTTCPVVLKLNTSSVSPVMAHSQHVHSRGLSRQWIMSNFPNDAGGASHRPVSSQTHRHTQSAGPALSSPLLAARK